MTRKLLLVVKYLHGPFLVRLMIAGCVGMALPIAITVDLWRLARRAARQRRVLSSSSTRCPVGDAVGLRGGWECSCRLVFEGHGFAACPHCGEVAYAVACACGRHVANPLFVEGPA